MGLLKFKKIELWLYEISVKAGRLLTVNLEKVQTLTLKGRYVGQISGISGCKPIRIAPLPNLARPEIFDLGLTKV